jgi:hypothetical protein
MNKPYYKNKPIHSVQSLAQALKQPQALLESLATRAPKMFIGPKKKPKPKKPGEFREVFDTKWPLKGILQKINRVIFENTYFPSYLTGSIKGRDFIANVAIHKGAKSAITEDISKFFDSIREEQVRDIWLNFFHFSQEVADLLTRLMTRDGRIAQGTPTSSYIANLVFWAVEPALEEALVNRGFSYSRYVDDIVISSLEEMSNDDKTWAIAQVYAMFGKYGFKPERSKHESFNPKDAIRIMGLNANSKNGPTLTQKERSAIRTQVFQLEKAISRSCSVLELQPQIKSTSGKIIRLCRLHPTEGQKLRSRLDLIQTKIESMKI